MKFQKSDTQTRAVFTVTPHADGWGVEHEGELLDPCRTMEEARAAATRRARACQDLGRPCQINVSGERGFFAARARPATEAKPETELLDTEDNDDMDVRPLEREAMPA
ncbi:MAG: DUF2188 domain-containing protein [Proteobacteria bacterium]|nr:DUF2188 domain-containing protein [Pseudomonadota bacterium]